MDVSIAAKHFIKIMAKGKTGEAYNVASGFSIKIRDLLENILQENGYGMDIVAESAGSRSNEYDATDIYADIRKLSSLS